MPRALPIPAVLSKPGRERSRTSAVLQDAAARLCVDGRAANGPCFPIWRYEPCVSAGLLPLWRGPWPLAANHGGEGAAHVLRAVGPELLGVAGGPRGLVREHLHPFVVQGGASGRRLLHPEFDLDDVVGCAAGGLDAEPDLLEDVGDLARQVGRRRAGLRITAADDTRHHDVADAAGVGDRVLVLEAGIVDALALGHLTRSFSLSNLEQPLPIGFARSWRQESWVGSGKRRCNRSGTPLVS